MRLEDHIRDIPDFPKPGIVFKDITPLFLDAEALAYTVDQLAGWAREWEVDYVVSAEARGFVLGAAVAVAAGGGFILGRKPGKLPREVSSVEYALEYGVDALEVHSDAIRDGAACSCTTTCSRPAAPPARCATSWSRRAASWQDARS